MLRKINGAGREAHDGVGAEPTTDVYKVEPKSHLAIVGVGGVHSTVRGFRTT